MAAAPGGGQQARASRACSPPVSTQRVGLKSHQRDPCRGLGGPAGRGLLMLPMPHPAATPKSLRVPLNRRAAWGLHWTACEPPSKTRLSRFRPPPKWLRAVNLYVASMLVSNIRRSSDEGEVCRELNLWQHAQRTAAGARCNPCHRLPPPGRACCLSIREARMAVY